MDEVAERACPRSVAVGARSMLVQTLQGHSLIRGLDTTSRCFCGARSVPRRSQRRRLRQNFDNSPFRFNWITLTIRCAPRMVQLIPGFFMRFAMSLSPLLSMVPRLRASGGALGTRLRQSIPVLTLDSTYSLSRMAVVVSAGTAADINALANDSDP